VRLSAPGRQPVYEELALSYAIFNPIETHVHCFGAFLFDNVVGKTCGGRVISLQGVGGGRGRPSSSSVVRMGTASWALRNSPVTLALACFYAFPNVFWM
jgi:hypothetical protein